MHARVYAIKLRVNNRLRGKRRRANVFYFLSCNR